MVMHNEEIKKYLPHRYPFLLVDRVTSIEAGQWIEGYKNVSCNEPFFSGHFPNHPVMPGVLILEAMAQLSGILGHKSQNEDLSKVIYYFAGADNVKFKRAVFPGDKVDLKAEFMHKKSGVWKFNCQAQVEGELACKAEILCIRKEG